MNQQPEYQEVTDTVDVPRHAGVEGFVLAIREILRYPRVMSFSADNRGKISFTRFARREEPRKKIEIDFDTVSPSAIIRNGKVEELDVEAIDGNAAVVAAKIFGRAAADNMYPVAWVVGAASYLPAWHAKTTGIELLTAMAYGLPILRDRFIPDETLLLACAFGPGAALIDAQTAYKITMPNPNVQRPVEVSPPNEGTT